MSLDDNLIRSEARNRSALSLKHAIENSIVTNWDDMEFIWQYTFYVNTLYTPRILTGILYNPRTIRQQMTQIMFQKVNIPAIFIVNRAVLALLFIALTTGIALHSGYSVSHAVPAYQFHSFPL